MKTQNASVPVATLSPAILAQLEQIETSNKEHEARIAGLTDEQKLLANYTHYKAMGEKFAAIAADYNGQIKEYAEITGKTIVLGDVEAKVSESERVAWDAPLAQEILGDRCPLTVAVDTKRLDTMVKAGTLTQDEIKRLRTITTIKTLRIGKAK